MKQNKWKENTVKGWMIKFERKELSGTIGFKFLSNCRCDKGLGTWKELKKVFHSFHGTLNGVLESGLSELVSKELEM